MNEAIKAGGESYFRYRQIELIPEIAPMIAEALAKARLVTISGDSAEGGAAQSATSNITSVIQTVLAAQLVSGSGMLGQDREAPREAPVKDNGRQAPVTPAAPPIPTTQGKTGGR